MASSTCSAPCWENLSPGQTTYAEALERIQHNGTLTIIPPPQHNAPEDITWASTIIVQGASGGLTGDLWFEPTDDPAHPGALLFITLGVPKGTTLGDIIRWRGDPTRDTLFLHLYYDTERMEVLTTAIPRPHASTWTIDWEQPILEVIYEADRFYDTNPPSYFWPAADRLTVHDSK